MTKQRYFAHCRTKQEAKKTFRALAKKYHPDTNHTDDTTAIMAAIITEYESIIKQLPTDPTQTHNSQHADETDEQYKNRITAEMQEIINNISHLPINIEIIGTWIWVSGDTYKYKAYLTANNFTWSPKKRMFAWHAGPRYKRYGKTKDIDDIRATYGSTKVQNTARPSIA